MDIEVMEKFLNMGKNRYELVRVVSSEAKRISALLRLSDEEVQDKVTTIALRRVVEGKVKYKYAKSSGEE
ncbi:MAG TPA: DNA-directed RNA polymerase subunit omega [Candidatus Krumholzibacteriaceae bacterium]|nr:DNA-directed RNA polymerase subunit omega [Candidatus Krumholzibacteriaceae bacterium]